MLTDSVVHEFGGKVEFKVENYGDSKLAQKFGVTRYPAIFVDDVLVAKPKDFGWYGKGEGGGDGRYTPWKSSESHERFRSDLRKMIQLVVAGEKKNLIALKGQTQSIDQPAALPQFGVKDLSGAPLTSEKLSGRVVLVEFWATWCPPCRGTLAWLGKLKQQYGNRIEVVAVAIESDEKDVRQVSATNNLPIRWTMDSGELARKFGDITSVPTLLLFDQNGKTAKTFYGAPADLHQKAEAAIRTLLK